MIDVSLSAAFIAGLVSFLSPCVLPLVPGYISMLSGVGMEQLRSGQTPRANLLPTSLAFVIGFSVVFIPLGAAAGLAQNIVNQGPEALQGLPHPIVAILLFLQSHRTQITVIGGALVLLFGLHLLGVLAKLSVRTGIIIGVALALFGVIALVHGGSLFAGLRAVHFFSLSLIGFFGPALTRWLNRDVHLRSTAAAAQPTLWSAFLVGFAFAFGWSPCLGPILSAVLAMAASVTFIRAILMLTVYSAGLAIPFLLAAVGFGGFLRFYQRFRKYLHAVELFSGGVLLFVGGLVFFNKLTWLVAKLSFLNDAVLWLEKSLTGVK
jgi:cytochrome c-type biogenesis protein